MCNACHNQCCGSDAFYGCGCDGCFESECWSDDEEDDYNDDLYEQHASPPRSRFACVEVQP